MYILFDRNDAIIQVS